MRYPNRGQTRSLLFLVSVAVLGLAVTIGSCGGGGDGDDDGGGIQYTGLTTQATLTADGVTDALQGTPIYLPACEPAGSIAVPASRSAVRSAPRTVALVLRGFASRSVASATRWLTGDSAARQLEQRAVDFSYDGMCGGTLAFSGEHEDGDTGGKLTLTDFCLSDPATGVSDTLNGTISIQTVGDPSPTGPVTTSFTATSPNTIHVVSTTGSETTIAFRNLTYTYGVPGSLPTAASPDTLTVDEFLVRNDLSGNMMKIENLDATVVYLNTTTVEVAASARWYFPNTGFIDIATDPAAPFLIDRAAEELQALRLVVTDTAGETLALEVMAGTPGVLAATMDEPTFPDGAQLDCSALSLETNLALLEQLIGRIKSGF